MKGIYAIFFAAVVTEQLGFWFKSYRKNMKKDIVLSILTLAVSYVLVCDLNLNLLTVFELNEQCPEIGRIVTAVLISRGPAYFCKLIKLLENNDFFNSKDSDE